MKVQDTGWSADGPLFEVRRRRKGKSEDKSQQPRPGFDNQKPTRHFEEIVEKINNKDEL